MINFKNLSQFLKEIPKTDLHLHLDGSLRLTTLIEMAKAGKIELPSYTENGLRELVFKNSYKNLADYLQGFSYTCSVLRNKENLERSAYELAVDNQNEGVRYIEVRFAPQLFVGGKLSLEEVMNSVNNGLIRAKQEFNVRLEDNGPEFDYGIIVCAMRMFKQEFSPYYQNLFENHENLSSTEVIRFGALELAKKMVKVRDDFSIPIVGFDLAGQEDGHPASDFHQAYQYVHRNFMHKTVHAGEAYGAESIFQAITDCYADRLGHCLYLFDKGKIQDKKIVHQEKYIDNLVTFLCEKRITIEVCLSSNLQTNPELTSLKNHPFKKMIEKELSLTLCTDNRLISNTTMCHEIELAINHFNLSVKDLRKIVIYGFKRSFMGSYEKKRRYVRDMINYFDQIMAKYNLEI